MKIIVCVFLTAVSAGLFSPVWPARILDNQNSGTDYTDFASAIRSLGTGDTLLIRGDTAVFRVYSTSGITATACGTESAPIVVRAWPGHKVEIVCLNTVNIGGQYWIFENIRFNGKNSSRDLIRLQAGASCPDGGHHVLRGCELTLAGGDGITISSSGSLLDSLRIHHFFDGSNSVDHHGVVIVSGHNTIIRGCKIYDVHGDAVQLQ